MEKPRRSKLVIRRIRQAHCAKGPARCAKCREMDREVIGLLELHPPGQGLAARRVMPITIDGQQVWYEFDLLRVFESEEEARSYADRRGIADVEL